MNASTPSGPIFVLGSMRSGTTLLRLMLDSHPDVAIGTETGFMRGYESVKRVPLFVHGRDWYKGYGISEEEIDERLAGFYRDVFSESARRRGATRWGEKTPFHVWHASTMARAFPDAQFVAIVRHPVAVVRSLERWRYSQEDAIVYWVRINTELCHLARELGERLRLLRFEDLVENPAAVMKSVLHFLGLGWSDLVLEHHAGPRQAAATVEGGTDPREPIDASRGVSSIAVEAEALRRAVDRGTRELGGVLGYGPEPPFVVELEDPGARRWLLTGAHLDARLQRLGRQLPERLTVEPALSSGTELRDLINRLDRLEHSRAVRAAKAVRQLARARSVSSLVAALRALAGSCRKQKPPPRLFFF